MMRVGVKALREGLKAVKAVVESRNTIPILANVVIRSTPGQARLIATDLDIMVEQLIALEDPGESRAMDFTVQAGLLQSIAAKLPGEGVATIEADGNTGIIVRCGRARFKLPTLPSEDFPMLAAAQWDAQWEQDGAEIAAMIAATGFAMSTEEARYYLCGLYWHVPEGSDCLFAAATTGHQLARHHGPMPDGAAGMPGIILPRKAVKLIAELVAEHPGAVDVAVSTRMARFEVGPCVLTTKTIDGTFPDYSRVIPVGNRVDAWFDPAALAEAIDRVLVIQGDKSKAIALSFEADRILLEVTSSEHGLASEDVPATLTGDPVRIGFNGRYLLDMLARLKGAEGAQARVLLADAQAPSLWQTSDDAQALYVLMPLRV